VTRRDTPSELAALDDEALRALARSRGFPVGRTLSRAQLVDLLTGEDEEEEDVQPAPDAPTSTPLSTVTLARLYAQQGLEREAAALCRSVLAAQPGDARARRLVERLAAARRSARPAPAVADEGRHRFPPFHGADALATERAAEPLPESYGCPQLELLPRSPTTLYAYWDFDPERERHARELAAEPARRVLRLFSAWRGTLGVERCTRDVALDDQRRDAFVGACRPGALHRAAVGWLDRDGQFVPLCHSGSTQTPADRPHAPRRPVWRTLGAGRLAAPTVEAAVRLIERLKQPRVPMTLPWEAASGRAGPVRWPPASPPGAARPGEGDQTGGAASSWSKGG